MFCQTASSASATQKEIGAPKGLNVCGAGCSVRKPSRGEKTEHPSWPGSPQDSTDPGSHGHEPYSSSTNDRDDRVTAFLSLTIPSPQQSKRADPAPLWGMELCSEDLSLQFVTLRDTLKQRVEWVGAVVSCLSVSYRTDHKETICPPFSLNTLPKIHSDGHFLLLKAELTGSEPFRLKCNGALERF